MRTMAGTAIGYEPLAEETVNRGGEPIYSDLKDGVYSLDPLLCSAIGRKLSEAIITRGSRSSTPRPPGIFKTIVIDERAIASLVMANSTIPHDSSRRAVTSNILAMKGIRVEL